MRDRCNTDHRPLAYRPHISGKLAKRAFFRHLSGVNKALDHDLGPGRYPQVNAMTFDLLQRFLFQPTGQCCLIHREGQRRNGCIIHRGFGADDKRHRGRLSPIMPRFDALVPLTSGRHIADGTVRPQHLRSVNTVILHIGYGVTGDHDGCYVWRRILARCPYRYRQRAEIDIIAINNNFLTERIVYHHRRDGIQQRLFPLGVDFMGLDPQSNGIGSLRRTKRSGGDGNIGALHVIEQKPKTVFFVEGLKAPFDHAADFPGSIDLLGHPPDQPLLFENREIFAYIIQGHEIFLSKVIW